MTTNVNKPKRNHHILPQLYLKGFVIKKAEPFIWVYKRDEPYRPGNGRNTNNPYKDSIRFAGSERDFYADPKPDGSKDFDAFENQLESLEKPSNQIFDKLRARQGINLEEKRLFSAYLVLTRRRVRAGRTEIKQFVSKSFYDPSRALSHFNWPDTAYHRAQVIAIAERIRQAPDYDITAHNRVTTDSPASYLNEILERMTWTFYAAPHGQCFLTSDNPVYISEPFRLSKNISELSFPIASDIALVASWNKCASEGFSEAPPKIVKEVNRRTACMASSYIYSSINEQWIVKVLNNGPHEYHPIYSASSVYDVVKLVAGAPGIAPQLQYLRHH